MTPIFRLLLMALTWTTSAAALPENAPLDRSVMPFADLSHSKPGIQATPGHHNAWKQSLDTQKNSNWPEAIPFLQSSQFCPCSSANAMIGSDALMPSPAIPAIPGMQATPGHHNACWLERFNWGSFSMQGEPLCCHFTPLDRCQHLQELKGESRQLSLPTCSFAILSERDYAPRLVQKWSHAVLPEPCPFSGNERSHGTLPADHHLRTPACKHLTSHPSPADGLAKVKTGRSWLGSFYNFDKPTSRQSIQAVVPKRRSPPKHPAPVFPEAPPPRLHFARSSDVNSFMQMSAREQSISASSRSSQSTQDSVIPEDWFLDLQRLVQRLERCHGNPHEEIHFTVYTWYLDHSSNLICAQPKLATLGGFPNEWREDLIFPWRHQVRRQEHIFLDVVFPPYAHISPDQHIGHILLTQRQADRVSTLLVMDFSRVYAQRVVMYRAIAVPKQCSIDDIQSLAPLVAEHREFLRWEYPPLTSQQVFDARNGMSIKLAVIESDLSPRTVTDEFTAVQGAVHKARPGQLSQKRHEVTITPDQAAIHRSVHQAGGDHEPQGHEFEEQALMQLPSPRDQDPEQESTSNSTIPEDWYIDLQRLVSRFVTTCLADHEDEVFFSLVTWYIDHATHQQTGSSRVAHLGGYPPEWRSDIQFPWIQSIIDDEPVHLDLAFPVGDNLVAHEPIAHVILSQRRFELVSVMLVIELRYSRPMVFRSVLAVPSPCAPSDVTNLSPLAQEYSENLRWIQPVLSQPDSTFVPRDGMTIQLVAEFSQLESSEESDVLTMMQTSAHDHHVDSRIPQNPQFQGSGGLNRGLTPCHSSMRPHVHGINLPPNNSEPATFEFNIHAAAFIPGQPPLQALPEDIQDLYEAWSQLSFSWQAGTIRNIEVVTWFVDHRMLYPSCLQGRHVALDAQYHQWETLLKARWNDQIDPSQIVDIVLVRPSPPRLEPNIAAHVIIIQAPRDEWVSSLVSVDDSVLNRINDGRLMRLVITTDEHFAIEHVVQSCGYPTTCTWMHQSLRCFAWIQEYQMLPGRLWPGSSGTSIFLSITRTPPIVHPVQQVDQVGLVQTSLCIHHPKMDPKMDHAMNPSQRLLTYASTSPDHDVQSFMAVGNFPRRSLPPDAEIINNPGIAHQETLLGDDPDSDIESSSSSITDTAWQEAVLYSPRSEPVVRQVNLVSRVLRRYQIAQALRWHTEDIHDEYPLAVRSHEMHSHPCNARLVRHRTDLPAESPMALVLIDTTIHPYPPRWDAQTIRKPMFVFHSLTAKQILRAMFLGQYCSYAILPCLVYHNNNIWHQDTDASHILTNGDYIVLHIPPPNEPQSTLPTRCVAVATYHGYSFEILELFGPFPDDHIQSVPNPYQVMIDQDLEVVDNMTLVQIHITLRVRRRIETWAPPESSEGIMCPMSKGRFWPRPKWTTVPETHMSKHGCCLHPEVDAYTSRQRLGEAKVPGPALPVEGLRWAIGAINPTGLAGKATLFTDLPKGIYAISETHLTSRGKPRFNQELWHAKSVFTLSTGYDAPYKKANMRAVGGKQTGVAFLTSYPCRSIQVGWNTELYQTSRLHAATFQINNTCIAGGVCYGYAHAPDSRATQDLTDSLLEQLTSLVVEGFPGPAFVAGDFNQHPGALGEPRKWESKGWKDIQTWAQELWGVTPGPTCCQVSRKDFVYLSPSLQALLISCSNSFDRFPDHSTLHGILEAPSQPMPIARWPKPTSIDYTEVAPQVVSVTSCPQVSVKQSPTEQYAAICSAFEQHVSRVRVQHQLSPLLPAQLGRGQTLERKFIKPQVVSIKNARHGEFQPSFNSWSLTHCRWVTQLRRLQHYVKHVRKSSSSATAIEHRAAVWRSIVLAAGFPNNFAHWWQSQVASDPSLFPWLPDQPPDLVVAEQIAQFFQARLKEFESHLLTKRLGAARATRIQDVNRIYRDVRKPMPVPVQMLVAKSVAHVVDIVDEGSVIVDSSDAIQHASVLESRTGPLHVIHIEESQVWFTSPHTLSVGDSLGEVHLKGQIHDIHDEFIKEWMKRWDRHRHLASSHWDEVLDITETLLHCPVMELTPITLTRWKAAIKSKKPSSATGLDALSRKDLLAFPDELHAQILQLLHIAETTGQWPKQLLQGAVHSLEKTPGAETVNEYRPITIMPLVYRIYTSIRSREILHHLKQHVPPTLLGNIPGRQATSLWWTMQHRIELALQSSEPLTGATSDVVKAFNHLPREVTFQVALRMGVHPNVVRAWASSAAHLQRHFVVKNSPSAQVSSTTGFVEGCGLSVVAMVLINTLLHAYLQHKHPEVTFTTYVDNFELQSRQVSETTQALQSLEGFCKLLDIQLDKKKTYRWAVTASGRQDIRAAALEVVTAARDLGAHLQFDSRQTNATVTNKFKALPALWHLLSRSQSTYEQKLKVLRTVAWPRAMYSVSIVHVGNAHFADARAGAFQAIGGAKAGANPQIHLSLTTHPTADPEFFALWNTVQQFRRNIPPDLLDTTLAVAAVVPKRQRKPGPGGVLITRLESVCWAYKANGIFTDGEGGFIHILDAPVQELNGRLIRAWQQMVGRQWESRKGFQGLRFVSPELSKPEPVLGPEDLGFIRAAQNGTFYTHDALHNAGIVENALCKFCQSQDSVFHRHWACSHTAPSRQLIPPDVLDYIHQAPQCLQEHGWATEPEQVRIFRNSLALIPDTMMLFVPIHRPRSHFDLFCDGTGIDPKQPSTRLVAWSVVLAGVDPQQTHVPIAWGGVPGQHQTVVRAELAGFVSALIYGLRQHRLTGATFAIWSDCETIIRRARSLQQGFLTITSAMSDHDLWQVAQALLPSEEICHLHHIKSHQVYHDEEAWIQWACTANDFADRMAELALKMLPMEVLQSQAAASQAYRQIRNAIKHVHRHMVRVARLSVETAPITREAPNKPTDHHPVIPWNQIALLAADQAPEKLRFPGFHKLVTWFQQIHDPGAAPKWYSWYELLFAFQIMTGEWGIQSTSKNNTWKLYDKLQEYDLKQTCRSWASYLIQMIRIVLPDFKAEDSRPANARFRCWAMGTMCQLDNRIDAMLHEWLQSQLGDRPIQKVTTLQVLPVASLTTPMEVPVVRHGLHRFWRR